MSRIGVIVLLFVSLNCFSQASLKKASAYSKSITAADLKQSLTVLAGPGMEGRETGTPGQVKAADFIEQQMKAAGLLPAVNGSYRQFFPIYRDSVKNASLTINDQPLTWQKDFAAPATNFISNLSFSEITFVNTDDSAWKQNKIDVSGKLVLLYSKKPKEAGGHSPIPFLISAVMKKGAAAALVVDSLMNQELNGDFEYNKMPSKQSINYFTITPEIAASLLDKKMDSSKLPSMVYKMDVSMRYDEKRNTLHSSNVVGYIPGKIKKDEYLVISALHVHIGKKDSVIWYGADDDGSGTVSLLEIAHAFGKARAEGYEPERSIVFLSVSGEEKGLWGSRYYTEHPVFPLSHTTADLNIDMVGRVDSAHIKSDTPNYVYVIGDDRISSELVPMTEIANGYTKLQLDRKFNDPKDPNKFYSRSDHYNFAEKGVPVIFYFNGTHPDYHRVTDTVDKINFDIMAKRAQLVFLTAWQMANSPNLLVRDKPLKKYSNGTN
jgi:hypothetical protein